MIKINNLEIENVKSVKAVRVEPSQNGLTIIGGKNGQVKTSVLDAIADQKAVYEKTGGKLKMKDATIVKKENIKPLAVPEITQEYENTIVKSYCDQG